jgi:hypothetical protein
VSKQFGYWSDLSAIKLSDDNKSWVHAARPGTYQHPQYGKIEFTFDVLRSLADSVNNKVRGIDIDIDYDHKSDAAMGGKAAGWVRETRVDNDGLWLHVEWTETAAKAIKSKEYKYFSPEFTDEWVDPNGTKHTNVLFGGGITNRPFLKNLLPVNLSELTFNAPPVINDPNPNPNPEGVEMKLSDLAKLIGLAETATQEEVTAKLTAMQQPTPPPTPPAPVLTIPDSIKQLAEQNPLVKQMMALYEASAQQNRENTQKLKEQAVMFKLNELDGSKIALAPTLRKDIQELATAIPVELSEKFWEIVTKLHEGTAAMVQLGEIGGAHVRQVEAPDAVLQFNELVNAAVASGAAKDAIDAYGIVAAQNPTAYRDYTRAVSIKD